MLKYKNSFSMKYLRKHNPKIAAILGIIILAEVFAPIKLIALTSGPTQPEVQSFQPINVTDMVNPATGDFSYNIPLMDIEGYPINIAYNSGINSDQEASWVGLGWNINVGSINRNMRGIPDEFNGEEVKTEYNIKNNTSVDIQLSGPFESKFNFELYGKEINLNLNGNLAFNFMYNNYEGFGLEPTYSYPSANQKTNKNPLELGLSISNSKNGLGANGHFSFNKIIGKNEAGETIKSNIISSGVAYNSRTGLKDLTLKVGSGVVGQYVNGSLNYGMTTFTPKINYPMKNYSVNFSFANGKENFGIFKSHQSVSGSASVQSVDLKDNTLYTTMYGYMNTQNAKKDDNQKYKSMLDINRTWDMPFNKYTPVLPVTNYTFDIYTASGHGVNGSFRAFRNDFGNVSDNYAENTTSSDKRGIEIGSANISKVGVDIGFNYVESSTGLWKADNNALQRVQNRLVGDNVLYEPYSIKEMGELSVDDEIDLYQNLGKSKAVRYELESPYNNPLISPFSYQVSTNNTLRSSDGTQHVVPEKNYRSKRRKRNQTLSLIRFDQLNYAGLGSNDDPVYNAPAHHIGEIILTKNDGVRYYYGLPAYNTFQEETSFSVGMELNSLSREQNIQSYKSKIDGVNDLVYYKSNDDNSVRNIRGNDNYYHSTQMPAFSYTHMLTSILSADYVDIDNIKGPSDGDIGNFTLFKYKKSPTAYKWRTPYQQSQANYNAGVKSDYFDDKANYVYGEKEVWYLDKIETKNTIAIFILENRKDSKESAGRNGGMGSKSMKLLRKISLYSKPEYLSNSATAVPIKEVHFEYDYSLCPKTINNEEMEKVSPNYATSGKLTLKKIYFTYGTSNRSAFSPYTFDYTNRYDATFNPEYGLKDHDRWGNFKPNRGSTIDSVTGPDMTNSEFSYVEQNKSNVNKFMTAWTLSTIHLPSGGSIKIYAESDDYAYVQNKRAMQMTKILGFAKSSTLSDLNNCYRDLTSQFDSKNFLVVELPEPILNDGHAQENFRKKYLEGISQLYFKFRVDLTGNNTYEYVNGFVSFSNAEAFNSTTGSAYLNKAWIEINTVNMGDPFFVFSKVLPNVTPFSRYSWQYARENAQKLIFNHDYPENSTTVKFLMDMTNINFFTNLLEFLGGENGYCRSMGYANWVDCSRSFVRLNCPSMKKLGGGLRVKRIIMSDEWSEMIGGNETKDYGQEYKYTTVDPITHEVISSGVAAWEPSIGNDENPYFLPIMFKQEDDFTTTTKDLRYVEEPIGEAFYPTPTVAYSKVEIMNLNSRNINNTGGDIIKHATGKTIQEFYTAKDFPTITEKTDLQIETRKTNMLTSILNLVGKDFLTASQGYSIELNDMHGKPKASWVYAENDALPISGIEYKYQCEKYGADAFRLTNEAMVVSPDGSSQMKTIGLEYDFITDFREAHTDATNYGIDLNLDLTNAVPAVLPITSFYPRYTNMETRFRSAVVTKVINRYGILSETIAHDLGSTVSTENVAYDSETGLLLLTKTKNEFEDDVYSFNYPAHWYYKSMGQAYKNLGLRFENLSVNSAGTATLTNASDYFVPGDEFIINNNQKGWVIHVSGNQVSFVNEMGNPLKPGTIYKELVITRSGRRNIIGLSMGSVVSQYNPLNQLQQNKFNKVISATNQLFRDDWRTFCECYFDENSPLKHSKNPYAIGQRGTWRPFKSFAFLVDREHSYKNNNTNIRKDGLYKQYNPFWTYNGLSWGIDYNNWTWTSEITDYNPYGAAIENRDALNRYSASLYGYNNTIPTAIAGNAKYREIAYDGFEDYNFNSCSKQHFGYKNFKDSIVKYKAHTGTRSIHVNADTAFVNKQLNPCLPYEKFR